ncbi:hypothetical protein [Paenibacillus hexagrammi]|uniref:Uncharacterized protein n=1 Tax=Paenibacillus hexagrammi TaxID=2908839 RepID=A0ABY3SDT3_9BACL|nr:hypothetical protein [Paenibacillus sp. YPD9-1]UJF32137.1 hypothetical protein L0M14_20745 [Paenibacillus sp. YPD9-1]
METLQRYYADYRTAADADQSFKDATQAIAYHVIEQTDRLAHEGDLPTIQSLMREYNEIRLKVGVSNDSLKERLEQELVERLLER